MPWGSDGKAKFSHSWGQAFSEFNWVLILIFSRLQFSSFSVIVNYWNILVKFSRDLLAVFMFWFCPAFFQRDMNVYLSFLSVTLRPVSLPVTCRAAVTYLLGPCQCIRYCICVVTRLRVGLPRVWIPVGGRNFSFRRKRGFFPEGKATGAWSWPLTSVQCRG